MKNHYISEYLKLECSGQLQELFSQSKNPWKEITESMCAYKNVKEFINIKDGNIVNYFIGDGSLCLTGALFSFITKNWNISIDPIISRGRVGGWAFNENVRGFNFIAKKYQEIDAMYKQANKYNLILVHAHVNLEELASHFPNWNLLFTNPCCNPIEQTFSVQFQEENNISVLKAGYDEHNISPKNMVFVYKNNKSDPKKSTGE